MRIYISILTKKNRQLSEVSQGFINYIKSEVTSILNK